MVLKHGGSAALAGLSALSLFLALSVYYIVDNIARPSEDTERRNHSTDRDDETSAKLKGINPLTEILYQQLFQKKSLEVCPVYLENICRWDMHRNDNETTHEKSHRNTTTRKLNKFNGIIRLCQVFGIKKYQDVCFYMGNSVFEETSSDNRKISQILQDCAYINDKGYPCVVKSDIKSEYLAPRNVCVSDSATLINFFTKRCRHREESHNNNISNFIPFEDIIYEQENNSYGKRARSSANSAPGDNSQQYKSGSNKTKTVTNATSVVCHILLAALLVVSASVALFEVCRDRLSHKKVIIGDPCHPMCSVCQM
jgi:hypothetical protein